MRWSAIQVKIIFLDVLAVVSLAVSQTEKPLFYDWVFPVPQGEGKTKDLLVIGNAAEAILAPAVSTGASLVMGEEVPSVTRFAVVLTYSTPLPLTQIGPPLFLRNFLKAGFLQS